MFPKELDGAKVLYYTPKGKYSNICYSNGDKVNFVKFLAICKYQSEIEEYYLFECDENHVVVGDSVWNSIEECMKVANSSYGGNILWVESQ